MCNPQCLDFGKKYLTRDIVEYSNILEVGSRDINGTLRFHCQDLDCYNYLGIDIEKDQHVNEICDICDDKIFELCNNIEILICTEVLEHIGNWRKAISNMKQLLNANGYILITTRSKGFGYHSYPHDYWRYEVEDMQKIFSDFEILALEKDIEKEPGVLLFAKKPENFIENDLEQIELYRVKETEK